MFDSRSTIRWYFNNSILVWGLLSLLVGGGLLFYNYFANTLSLERIILIISLTLALWLVGKKIFQITLDEVQKELNQMIDNKQQQENYYIENDFIQIIPIPALMVEINSNIIKDCNDAFAQILHLKMEEIIDTHINDINILQSSNLEHFLFNLTKEKEVRNAIIRLKDKTYNVWANYTIKNDSELAFLLLIPISKIEDTNQKVTFNTSFYEYFSHDIFDALNAISGFITLIESEIQGGKKIMQYNKIIESNTKKIQYLFSNYIQNKYKEYKPILLNYDFKNLNFLINDILNKLSKEYPNIDLRDRVTFNKSLPDEIVFLFFDGYILYQLFLNLFLYIQEKFPNSYIEIEYKKETDKIKFLVKVKFYSILRKEIDETITLINLPHNHILYPQELFIVTFKRILQKIESDFSIQIYDENTVLFIFSIPFQGIEKVENDKVNEHKLTEEFILLQKKILIVEDIEFNRLLLNEFLSGTGAQLFFASTGKEALECCNQHQDIEIILLDIKLPDINGFNLIEQLKKICPRAIIIAQTAFASIHDKKQALEAGFSYYLSKPLKQEILLKTLTRAIREHLN